MIFYIKLIKLKKLNKEVLPSFTLLELIIVLIIIGILALSVSIKLPDNNLQVAADELVKNIRFTQSLALKDDKYQPFPVDNSKQELNRSKYWFKQWWHLKITNASNYIIYYIFSDAPKNNTANFDKKIINGTYQYELAKNSENKYLVGIDKSESGIHNYPSNNVDKTLNLTKKYGIKRVEFSGYFSSSMPNGKGNRIDLLFDNFGNVFQNEGLRGDGNDINPLDANNRKLLTKNVAIKLCTDSPCIYSKNKCIQVNITPSGYTYISTCY